jgi:DNA-binding HxlR family transcriptional regulator
MLGILHTLSSSTAPLRFRDLQRQLHIPPKTLSQRLRTLVERGFLSRHAYREIPPRVEYAATAKLRELLPMFHELSRWAERNTMTATAVISVVGAVPAARPRSVA